MKKCPTCQKKANNLDIICKCGGQFCMAHRMPEDHGCTFDFKQFDRQRLLKTLTESPQPKLIESTR